MVFGIAYGGVMPLYAVLAREYFGAAHHGHGVRRGDDGCRASAWRSGRSAGGWIFDTFGGYSWLYVGSFGIGLAAVAIALASRRKRRPAQPSLDLSAALTARQAGNRPLP